MVVGGGSSCDRGTVIVEHPQFPTWAFQVRQQLTPVRPSSLWGLRVVRALTRLRCVRVVSTDQCLWGSESRKPTTLLVGRLPGMVDTILMAGDSGRCCHRHGAHRTLVGLESAGSFVTAVASPHPPGLSALFGSALFAHAKEVLSRRQEQDSELLLDPPAEIQALAVPMDCDAEPEVQPHFHG